jgi:hypothetical protein
MRKKRKNIHTERNSKIQKRPALIRHHTLTCNTADEKWQQQVPHVGTVVRRPLLCPSLLLFLISYVSLCRNSDQSSTAVSGFAAEP